MSRCTDADKDADPSGSKRCDSVDPFSSQLFFSLLQLSTSRSFVNLVLREGFESLPLPAYPILLSLSYELSLPYVTCLA